jgi:hypothetical protein
MVSPIAEWITSVLLVGSWFDDGGGPSDPMRTFRLSPVFQTLNPKPCDNRRIEICTVTFLNVKMGENAGERHVSSAHMGPLPNVVVDVSAGSGYQSHRQQSDLVNDKRRCGCVHCGDFRAPDFLHYEFDINQASSWTVLSNVHAPNHASTQTCFWPLLQCDNLLEASWGLQLG